jgi:hypothetical protein
MRAANQQQRHSEQAQRQTLWLSVYGIRAKKRARLTAACS